MVEVRHPSRIVKVRIGMVRYSAWIIAVVTSFWIQQAQAQPIGAASIKTDPALFGSVDPSQFQKCESRRDRMDEIACRVGAAAHFAASGLYHMGPAPGQDQDRSHYFAAFAALEAMTMTQTIMSGARYGFNVHTRVPVPGASEECLGNWIGICGHHVDVFRGILQRLNIKSRPLQFVYLHDGKRNSHIVAEVQYASGWHFFDISNGAVFPSDTPLLFHSYDAIRQRRDLKAAVNENNVWFAFRKLVGVDDLDYLRLEMVSIITDLAGQIRLTPQYDSNGRYVEKFENLHNYIGDNQNDGRRDGISFEFVVEGRKLVRVDTLGVGCADDGASWVKVGDQRISIQAKQFEAMVDGAFRLEIETQQDVCYVVLKQMEIVRE